MSLDGPAITVSDSGRKSAVKDPNATIDFTFLWGDWLADAGETYLSHQILVIDPDDVVVPLTVLSSGLQVGGKIRAVVTGGTLGTTHQLVCRLFTAGGLIDDQTLFIKIRQL